MLFLLEQSFFFWKKYILLRRTYLLHHLLHGTYCILVMDFLAVPEVINRAGTRERQAKWQSHLDHGEVYEHLLEQSSVECFIERIPSIHLRALSTRFDMRKACSVSKIDVRSGQFSFTKKTVFLSFFIFEFKFWYYIYRYFLYSHVHKIFYGPLEVYICLICYSYCKFNTYTNFQFGKRFRW